MLLPLKLLAKFLPHHHFCKSYIGFLHVQKISRLRARPGGFPIAPWTPSGLLLDETFASKETETLFSQHSYKKRLKNNVFSAV